MDGLILILLLLLGPSNTALEVTSTQHLNIDYTVAKGDDCLRFCIHSFSTS